MYKVIQKTYPNPSFICPQDPTVALAVGRCIQKFNFLSLDEKGYRCRAPSASKWYTSSFFAPLGMLPMRISKFRRAMGGGRGGSPFGASLEGKVCLPRGTGRAGPCLFGRMSSWGRLRSIPAACANIFDDLGAVTASSSLAIGLISFSLL